MYVDTLPEAMFDYDRHTRRNSSVLLLGIRILLGNRQSRTFQKGPVIHMHEIIHTSNQILEGGVEMNIFSFPQYGVVFSKV